MQEIIKRAAEKHIISRKEIIGLLTDNSTDDVLFKTADKVRKKYKGDGIYIRGLIEFSNVCKRNCLYCGLRRDNDKLKRFSLNKEEILRACFNAKKLGYKTVVLQSGENNFDLTDIIYEIKKLDLTVTLSTGEKSFEEYKNCKEAGVDRFLLKIETTDKDLYEKYDPEMSFENRINCIKNLKKLGYETGSGTLVGLKGQTVSSLADDILFFKENDLDMIGTGVFIANKNTPFKNCHDGDFRLALKVMAITRLLLPTSNLPATTAMETIFPEGRKLALCSGANVVMLNVVESDVRKFYEIYEKNTLKSPFELKKEVEILATSIGRYLC